MGDVDYHCGSLRRRSSMEAADPARDFGALCVVIMLVVCTVAGKTLLSPGSS
jgi:hypothetical protein